MEGKKVKSPFSYLQNPYHLPEKKVVSYIHRHEAQDREFAENRKSLGPT